jgi:hypothetical protein
MYRKLAIIVLASMALTVTAGCGEVTTTEARKSFVKGLNADAKFPCKLTKISTDMRKVKMICDETTADEAAAALGKACDSFDRLDLRQVRIQAGEDKRKCIVADSCACQ